MDNLYLLVVERKKIARVLTSYYRIKPGGLCKRLFRAISALLKQGHEVHYLAVEPFPIEHPACYFHRFPWPVDKADGLLFWAVFHLLAPIMLSYLGIKYRITHAFSFSVNYAMFMQPLRVIKKTPLTLFLRADTIENHRIKGMPSWLIYLESFFEGLAIWNVRVFGVSKVLTDAVTTRHVILRSLKVGVFRNDIAPDIKKIKINMQRPLRMACVGVLEPRKNQAFILACVKNMSPRDLHLNLYGIGPDEPLLHQLIGKYGLGELVTLKGWMDAKEIWKNVDILLMPSQHEGASNSMLEAIGHGIPVLASDIPENREMLSAENLLRVNDESQWRCAIEKIIYSPEIELKKLIISQSEAAQPFYFDWESQVCKKILAVS